MNQVIVFPRGQLNADDKERLTEMGIVAVEADNPKDVVVLVPGSSITTGDDLLMAALAGITCSTLNSKSDVFAATLYKRLKDHEEATDKDDYDK